MAVGVSNIDENIYIYVCIQTQEVQLISSQSCSMLFQNRRFFFFSEKRLTFQCTLFRGCDILTLTGMFGQFFVFFQDNCEGSNLKIQDVTP